MRVNGNTWSKKNCSLLKAPDGVASPLRGPRLVEREGNSDERMCAMNVLVATDGSKYGRWGLNWVAKLPFVKRPSVMVLYVIDSAALR